MINANQPVVSDHLRLC